MYPLEEARPPPTQRPPPDRVERKLLSSLPKTPPLSTTVPGLSEANCMKLRLIRGRSMISLFSTTLPTVLLSVLIICPLATTSTVDSHRARLQRCVYTQFLIHEKDQIGGHEFLETRNFHANWIFSRYEVRHIVVPRAFVLT